MSTRINVTCRNEDCEEALEAEVRMDSPGTPGKLTGPWEDCYPPEPAEFSLVDGGITCHKCGTVMSEEEFFDLYHDDVLGSFNRDW